MRAERGRDLKKTTALYVLLSVCALIFAIYFAFTIFQKNDEEPSEPDVYLYVDQNEVSEIFAFSFVGKDTSLQFARSNGVWKYSNNATLPVNGAVIEKMLESVDTVLASKLISENADESELSQYGLSSPSYTLTISTPHGEKGYIFGDLIKSKGLRYMMRVGSSSVYLAEDDIVESFSLDLSDCLATDTSPVIIKEKITSIKTECGGFVQTNTTDSAGGLANALATLSLERAVDFGADKFYIFGLSDSECITLTVALDGEDDVKIKLGLGETDEFIYALVENESGVFSEMIYLVSCADKDSLNSHLRYAFDRRDGEGK